MTGRNINVFYSLDTSRLIELKFREKKIKNPSFSIRSWAKQMGLKSHGSLQQILSGNRKVPKKYVPLLSKSLSLSDAETLYLDTLIDFERAGSEEERDFYYKRLSNLRPNHKEIKIKEIENFKYWQNPLHSIIRTMTERKDFQSDSSWIKKQLNFTASKYEIEEVIERLLNLKLLSKENGKLKKLNQYVQSRSDVPSKAVRSFHQKMCTLAAQALEDQSVEHREFNSINFNIKENELSEAKQMIREFRKKFIDRFEASDQSSDQTYQLNLQLFSLTKIKKGE